MQLEFAAPLTLMELEISLMYPSAPLLCFGNRYEQLARGKKKLLVWVAVSNVDIRRPCSTSKVYLRPQASIRVD